MNPTLPRQLQGDIRGLPPAASSVSSPQHSRHREAPVLDTDAADALRCMLWCCCWPRGAQCVPVLVRCRLHRAEGPGKHSAGDCGSVSKESATAVAAFFRG
jgi:hypothetical protein